MPPQQEVELKKVLAAAVLLLSACANPSTEDVTPSTEVTTTTATPTTTVPPTTTTTTAPTTTTTVATTTTTSIDWVETEPSARPVTTLVDPGAEPHEIHEYELEVGATSAGLITLDVTIDQTLDGETFSISNAVAMEFTTEVVGSDERGFVVEFTYSDVEATSSDAASQDALEQLYTDIEGLSILQLIAPNGETLATAGFDDIPGSELFQGGLAGASVPLPFEPFGAGAVWETVGTIVSNGVEFTTTSTVTAVAIDGDLITLDLSATQTLGDDSLAALLGGLDPSDYEAELESVLSGDATWDLGSPTPVESLGVGQQDFTITVTAEGQESSLVQRTTTETRFSSR